MGGKLGPPLHGGTGAVKLMKMDAKSYTFGVVIEKDDDGYFGYCPSLEGCCSQGESHITTLENLRDAIKLNVEDKLASGEPVSRFAPGRRR